MINRRSFPSDSELGFVHCHRGDDRTGLGCAADQITAEGRSNEEAIEEMRDGGYGFWPGWATIIRYLKRFSADISNPKRPRDPSDSSSEDQRDP